MIYTLPSQILSNAGLSPGLSSKDFVPRKWWKEIVGGLLDYKSEEPGLTELERTMIRPVGQTTHIFSGWLLSWVVIL